jgi:uncharacterized protein (TIGR00297 family)
VSWLFGALLSGAIAAAAYAGRALDATGAAAAIAVGTIVFAAGGWRSGGLLVLFFVSSSLLSRIGRQRKAATAEYGAGGSRRNATQVLANGGIAAALALGSAAAPSPLWHAMLTGSLAAVTADTWATELGFLSRTPPRLITTGKAAPAGMSGAISRIGTLAAAAGGATIGIAAGMLLPLASLPSMTALGLVSGVGGAMVDSLLGATVQALFRCDVCGRDTEARVHRCGRRSRPVRGVAWMSNDLVNLLAAIAGAGFGGVLWTALPR